MSFDELIDKLKLRLALPLPGAIAHEPMRSVPVGDVLPDFTHKLPPKPGSVLILLYEEDGVIKFPLMKRPEYTGAHSGQVSLPGGKAEAGENTIETALREGHEEIGIAASDVTVIGTLSNFFVMPSNFMVTPVIGTIQNPVFIPDRREVAKILSCNLYELLAETSVQTKELLAAGRYRMIAPYFEVEGETVWGATAMILNELRMVLKEVL